MGNPIDIEILDDRNHETGFRAAEVSELLVKRGAVPG